MTRFASRFLNGFWSRRPGRTSSALLLGAALSTGSWAPAAAQEEHVRHTMTTRASRARASTDHIEIIDDADRKQLTIIMGPIDLPARSDHHMEQLPVQEGVIPFDLTIRGYRTEIVDKEGSPVPRVVLHHMNLLDPNRRELFLPIMLRVLAASHETPPVSLPGWLFGVPMRGGSNFLALMMLHNPTDTPYEGVSVHLIIEYERRQRLPVYAITPFHLDAMYPVFGTKAFDLPPGRATKSWEASPVIRGLIVGLSGHLHAHATRLTLEDVTTGELLYDIRPDLDDDGQVVHIPMLKHRGKGVGALVVPEHIYRVTAEYYNPFDVTLEEGGMGAVAGAFVPLESWPAANPDEPLYAADYEWVLKSQSAHGEERSSGR